MGKKLVAAHLATVMLFVFMISGVHAAEYVNPGLLATSKMVTDNIAKPDWVVIDCRAKDTYDKEHVSGAISLGDTCAKVMRDKTSRIKKTADLEKLLGGAGISETMHVVVYSQGAKDITDATVGFWILETLGHKNVHFLNGGLDTYKAAGGKVDNVAVTKTATTYKATYTSSRIATTAEMLGHANIALGKANGTDVNIIDSRTEGEYKGSDIRALRGGHIPGTDISVSHVDTFDSKTGVIKSMDDLEKLFGKLDKSKRTIGYCQTGTRSTLTYLELRLMGFADPANYDDSWIVWGSNVNYPANNENWYAFTDIGAKKDVDAAKADIAALKIDLEAAKKAAAEAKKTADEAKATGKGICGPTALIALAMLPLAGYGIYRKRRLN